MPDIHLAGLISTSTLCELAGPPETAETDTVRPPHTELEPNGT